MNLDTNLELGFRKWNYFFNFALTFAVDLHSKFDLDLTYIIVLIPIKDIIYLKMK